MLIDRHPCGDVSARVPELVTQTDPVLRRLDRLLDDDVLYARVRTDLGTCCPLTLAHGRRSAPAEVLPRLPLVKHLYRWSYRETGRRVADRRALRRFRRVYFRSAPDATTLPRRARTIRPATLHALDDRVAPLARQARVTRGRKLRIDGTAVRTVIRHPTDSSLLTDGARILSRLIRRGKPLVRSPLAGARDAFRTRMRTMRRGLRTPHRSRRRQGDDVAARRAAIDTRPVAAAWATVTRAEHVAATPAQAGTVPQAQAGQVRTQIARCVPPVRRALDRTERRAFAGGRVAAGEGVVGLFGPHARIIPRHKGGAAVEFGRLVAIDGVEGGIASRSAVLADKTAERGRLVPALAHRRRLFGKAPRPVAGDRGAHAAENEAVARAAGVRHPVTPRSGKLTATRRADEQTRSWRRRRRWRAGIEGRLSSLRRDHGLRACPDHGEEGFVRRAGRGIIAGNLRHIGQKLAA